jgi:hypothetical protein
MASPLVWIVRCRVSGGASAPLKSNGEIGYFLTYEAAAAEARRLVARNPAVEYWVEGVDGPWTVEADA